MNGVSTDIKPRKRDKLFCDVPGCQKSMNFLINYMT